jgi:hypothetical protein
MLTPPTSLNDHAAEQSDMIRDPMETTCPTCLVWGRLHLFARQAPADNG